ncbi:MAG: apolipoprotein N-acyltransferase [Thermohalobaculum sp.]|nr:apolipoprotein N-acyltransferase [Thermohalobaculum sp.]
MRDMTTGAAAPSLTGRLAAAVARLSGWRRLAAAFAAGMALTGGQTPVSAPGLWFLAMPVLVWLVDGTAGPRQAAAVGWAAAFGMFVTGLFWIGHAFLVDAEQFAWMMPFAVTLLPAGLGLFWALAFWIARRTWAPGSLWRVALLAALITLAEYARSQVLTGLPWGLAAYVWVETPVAQAASVIGPHGLSLVTYGVTALPLVAIAGARPRLGPGAVAAALAVAAVPALWVWGTARVPPEPAYAPGAPVLRVVQPNATQRLKWNPDYAALFYRRLIEATAAPADPALGPPAAVIWPETAVPFLPAEQPAERAAIAAAARGAPVILGALHREQGPAGVAWSNALMAILPDGSLSARYDKAHLVPFGEYVPWQSVLGRIGIRQLAERGGFTPGPGPRRIEVAGLPAFSALICYEAIFPDEVIPEGPRPDWFLQVTNDGWFGSYGGPQQHLAQARFRAIEQGLPLVRAANTGISAVIDPHGRVLRALALDTHGAFDARLPAPLPPTAYARLGDAPALALVLALVFAARLRRRRIG